MEVTHATFGSSQPNQPQEATPQMTETDLFQLLELGRVEDELEIEKITFKLRTLSAAELSAIYKDYGSEVIDTEDQGKFVKDSTKYLSLSSIILAHAIVSVNNVLFENMLDNDGSQNIIELKKQVVSNFQWPVIHKLMAFYNELAGRANAKFDGEELKK